MPHDTKAIVAQVKKLHWRQWVERPYGVFMATLGWPGVSKKQYTKVSLPGFGYRANLYQFPNAYYAEELTAENYRVLVRYLQTKTVFDITKALQAAHAKNKKQLTDLKHNTKLSPKQKIVKVAEMDRLYFPFHWIIISLERYYAERLTTEVPRYVTRNTEVFINRASIPKKKNAYAKMLTLLVSGVPIETVYKKYYWLKSRDGFSDFFTRQELVEIRKNHRPEKRKVVVIPTELKGLFSQIQELTFFRTARTDAFYEFLALARPIFEALATSIGVSFKELEDYDVRSIISGQPKKYPRPYSYAYLDGREVVRKKPIVAFSKTSQKEIRGTVAFQGRVRGGCEDNSSSIRN